MIFTRYRLQIRQILRSCLKPPLTIPRNEDIGCDRDPRPPKPSVRRTEPGSMRSRCRTARTLPLPAARTMCPSPRPGQQRHCSPRGQSG